MSSLSFTSIDFETANDFRGSPCAVGLTKVQNGLIIDTKSMLIKPPRGHQHFDSFNTSIHGIKASDVKDEPEFKDVWPIIDEYIGGDVLVAHNAAFDTGVIRYGLEASKMNWPNLSYVCTLVMSRRAIPGLLSYSLPFVVDALELDEFEHHNAAADSSACANILLSISQRLEEDSIENIAKNLNLRIGVIGADSWRGCVAKHSLKSYAKPLVENANPDADHEHPLYGEVVVFTGTLKSMTRQQAWDKVCFVGGDPDNAVTKRTTILVQGVDDPSKFRPGENLSSKARKVEKLITKGQKIEIMTEEEFLRSL